MVDRKAQSKGARRAEGKLARERERRRARTRGRLRSLAIGLAVVVGGVAIGFFLFRGASSGVAYAGDIRRGGTLERLELPALEGGGTVDYGTYADKPLVINFFASWCPNCVGEMPGFEQVHQELQGKVGFLGISQSDAAGASIELARQTGITYPTAIDNHGVFFNAAGGTGMPTTIFVRPGGEIADVWVGALDAASLERLIEQDLGATAS